MAKTSVDVDMAKVDRVKEVLGTETLRDTIDAALREVIRIDSVRRLVLLAEGGAFTPLLEEEADAEDRW